MSNEGLLFVFIGTMTILYMATKYPRRKKQESKFETDMKKYAEKRRLRWKEGPHGGAH